MLKILVDTEISQAMFEEIIVSAMEGGSNYWYLVRAQEFREDLPMDDNEPLAMRIADALYNDSTFKMAIYDVEDPDHLLGFVNRQSMIEALELASTDHSDHFHDLLDGNGDAITADVIFQLATLKEIVYG